LDSSDKTISSLGERQREQKLQELPKASLNTSGFRFVVLLSLATTAGQEKDENRRATKVSMAALVKGAGSPANAIFFSPSLPWPAKRRRLGAEYLADHHLMPCTRTKAESPPAAS
jgi:hypothetical protein